MSFVTKTKSPYHKKRQNQKLTRVIAKIYILSIAHYHLSGQAGTDSAYKSGTTGGKKTPGRARHYNEDGLLTPPLHRRAMSVVFFGY